MQKLYIDLHIHTNCSDGLLSPEQVVEIAKKKDIAAISITDHDTTNGIQPALKEGSKLGVEVIPGIELSVNSKYSSEGELHILGYFIDWENIEFQKKISIFREARIERAYKIIEKFKQININIDKEKLFNMSSSSSIGRLHFARILVEERYVKNIYEAFNKFLSFGKPAYVAKLRFEPEEAINLITKVGGIPILAHPYYSNFNTSTMISTLVDMGLQGIEVWHSKQPKNISENLLRIANKFNILAIGGSDYHGVDNESHNLGSPKIPYSILLKLKKYRLKNYEKRINTGLYR